MSQATQRPDRSIIQAGFLTQLEQMTPAERRRVSRDQFDAHKRAVWAANFPDEVPLLNGELEWIMRTSADLD